MERQGGKLESNGCDSAGPRLYWTTKVVARHGATSGCTVAVSVWVSTQKHVERDWKRHWLTKERVQAQSERESDRLFSLPLSPKSKHRWHSRSQRLHHPVLVRRCKHKSFRTSRWIHRWSWEHKNAESAKERGQARRRQVKSLKDQW